MTAYEPFTPPSLLRNAHIQSILNSVGPRKIRAKLLVRQLNSQALILTAKDGTRLTGEFDRSPNPKNAVVVLLHGWEARSWRLFGRLVVYRCLFAFTNDSVVN